jgi:hypothetical protein
MPPKALKLIYVTYAACAVVSFVLAAAFVAADRFL